MSFYELGSSATADDEACVTRTSDQGGKGAERAGKPMVLDWTGRTSEA